MLGILVGFAFWGDAVFCVLGSFGGVVAGLLSFLVMPWASTSRVQDCVGLGVEKSYRACGLRTSSSTQT